MRKILILISFICYLLPVKSQTKLLPGDITFIGINSDESTDDFSFLLLADISAGTSITFTDCGWNHSTGFNTLETESHSTWTSTSELEAGTVINIVTHNGTILPESDMGVITGDTMLISIAGDQILAYQGTKENPIFIAAISFNQNGTLQPDSDFDGASVSNSTTALPRQLKMGLNSIHIYDQSNYAEQDNSMYNGSIVSGSKLELLNAINTLDNWQTNDRTPFILFPFPLTFTLSASTLSVNNSLLDFMFEGESKSLEISSNTIWSIISSESWLTVNTSNGSGNAVLNVTAELNSNNESRTATLTLSATGVESRVITINQAADTPTGMKNGEQASYLIYPSTFSKGITIDAGLSPESVKIYNMSGILVATYEIYGKTYLNLSSLPQGIYLISLKNKTRKLNKVSE